MKKRIWAVSLLLCLVMMAVACSNDEQTEESLDASAEISEMSSVVLTESESNESSEKEKSESNSDESKKVESNNDDEGDSSADKNKKETIKEESSVKTSSKNDNSSVNSKPLNTESSENTSSNNSKLEHTHIYTVQKSVEATCLEPEHTLYICKCGYTEKDYWAGTALGDHEYESSIIQATCTSEGYFVNTCMNCGYVYYTEDIIPMTEHEWRPVNLCTDKKVCSVCGFSAPGTEHEWNTEDTLCTVERTCNICGFVKPATKHAWIPATCDRGTHCANCYADLADNTGHQWENGNCEKRKKCTKCGEEGDYEHKWIPATCQELMKCSLCNQTKGELAPHSWLDGSCRYCGISVTEVSDDEVF